MSSFYNHQGYLFEAHHGDNEISNKVNCLCLQSKEIIHSLCASANNVFVFIKALFLPLLFLHLQIAIPLAFVFFSSKPGTEVTI